MLKRFTSVLSASLCAAIALNSANTYASPVLPQIAGENNLVTIDSDQMEIEAKGAEIQIDLAPDDESNPLLTSEEVPAQLKILGKGVQSTSGLSLAVACVGKTSGVAENTCNALRTIESKQGEKPHWMGRAFQVTGVKDFKAQLKKEYRNKYRLHFLHFKEDPENSGTAGEYATNGLIFGVIGAAIFKLKMSKLVFYWSLGGALAFIFIVALCWSFHFDIVGATANLILAPFRGLGNAMNFDYTSTITAQNGWNWNQPETISDEKYEKLKSLLADFAAGNFGNPAAEPSIITP